MPASRTDAAQRVLDALLQEHGITRDTRVYREAERKSLTPTGTPGLWRVQANRTPSESVVDVYGPGYTVQAEQVGPGLAFAESASPNWQETMELRTLREGQGKANPLDRIEIEVRIEDLLRQGGLMYPVESVTVERAWYFTLPEGSIEVQEAFGRLEP